MDQSRDHREWIPRENDRAPSCVFLRSALWIDTSRVKAACVVR